MLLEQIFTNLQSRWQKAWWLRFFTKSTALGRLLDLKEKPNSFELVQTYLSSSWWNRLWFRSFLAWEELCRFYDIMNVAIFLKNENLLNGVNLNTLEERIGDQKIISNHFDRGLVYLGYSGYLDRCKYEERYYDDYYVRFDNFSLGSLVPGLKSLKSANILNQENFEAITKKRINAKCHAETLGILHRSGILTADNLELVTVHGKPDVLAQALSILYSADILTPENRKFVATHGQPVCLAEALSILNSAGIFTPDNLELVTVHGKPDVLAQALSILYSASICTPDNLKLVTVHGKPDVLAKALSILNSADIFTSDNRQFIATHDLPDVLAEALLILHRAQILTPENRQFIATHVLPDVLAKALSILNSAGILTPYKRYVAAHHSPDDFAEALSILERSGMLTPDNFELVAAHEMKVSLANVMVIFNSQGVLTPENLRELASIECSSLLTKDAWNIVWDRLPSFFLIQAENIYLLFNAARYRMGDDDNHNVNARLRRAVGMILEQHRARVAEVAAFKKRQSTQIKAQELAKASFFSENVEASGEELSSAYSCLNR